MSLFLASIVRLSSAPSLWSKCPATFTFTPLPPTFHPSISSFIPTPLPVLQLSCLPPSLGPSVWRGAIHVNVRKYQSRGGGIRQRGEDTLIAANTTGRPTRRPRLGIRTHTETQSVAPASCCLLKICCACAKTLGRHL